MDHILTILLQQRQDSHFIVVFAFNSYFWNVVTFSGNCNFILITLQLKILLHHSFYTKGGLL